MVDRKSQASGLGVGGGHTRHAPTAQGPKEWLWFCCLVPGSLEFPSLQGHLSSEKTSLRVGRARPGQDQAQATPYNGSTEATHPQLAAYRLYFFPPSPGAQPAKPALLQQPVASSTCHNRTPSQSGKTLATIKTPSSTKAESKGLRGALWDTPQTHGI